MHSLNVNTACLQRYASRMFQLQPGSAKGYKTCTRKRFLKRKNAGIVEIGGGFKPDNWIYDSRLEVASTSFPRIRQKTRMAKSSRRGSTKFLLPFFPRRGKQNSRPLHSVGWMRRFLSLVAKREAPLVSKEREKEEKREGVQRGGETSSLPEMFRARTRYKWNELARGWRAS